MLLDDEILFNQQDRPLSHIHPNFTNLSLLYRYFHQKKACYHIRYNQRTITEIIQDGVWSLTSQLTAWDYQGAVSKRCSGGVTGNS